jgi:NAD(P)-dependent dehydrogenase (short-subunit alcohol dehydrogenase family)
MRRLLWVSLLVGLIAGIVALVSRVVESEGNALRGTIPLLTLRSSYGYSFEQIPALHNQTIVVTGANSGLGFSSAKLLALKGAHVILACRDLERCNAAQNEISRLAPGSSTSVEQLDLGSLRSVKRFADRVARKGRLRSLILNAGIMHTRFGLTEDGIEQQFAVNHVAHQVLIAGPAMGSRDLPIE